MWVTIERKTRLDSVWKSVDVWYFSSNIPRENGAYDVWHIWIRNDLKGYLDFGTGISVRSSPNGGLALESFFAFMKRFRFEGFPSFFAVLTRDRYPTDLVFEFEISYISFWFTFQQKSNLLDIFILDFDKIYVLDIVNQVYMTLNFRNILKCVIVIG